MSESVHLFTIQYSVRENETQQTVLRYAMHMTLSRLSYPLLLGFHL